VRGETTARRPYSVGEEIANAVTHGVGGVLALVALVLLVVLAVQLGDWWRIASALAYGITLVLLYTASTLYHALPGPRVKHVFKIFDHASIYLLIAGTYTPFTLLALRGPWGWSLFAAVWTLAVAGVALEAFWVYRPKWLSALIYLVMGWLVIVAIRPLIAVLPPLGLWLLVAGGLAYTLGTGLYVMKRVPYTHAGWHLFVLAGSALHFFAVLLLVRAA